MIEGGLNIQLGLSSFRRNYENREWREFEEGGTVSHAKTPRGKKNEVRIESELKNSGKSKGRGD